MNVFELDADLVGRYEGFARSFTTIRADDIRRHIDEIYESKKFWPEPLIGVKGRRKRLVLQLPPACVWNLRIVLNWPGVGRGSGSSKPSPFFQEPQFLPTSGE